jgi:hypothetical protein
MSENSNNVDLTKEEKIKIFMEKLSKQLDESGQLPMSVEEISSRVREIVKAFDENQ